MLRKIGNNTIHKHNHRKMNDIDEPNKCSYCSLIIDSDDFLNCKECEKDVHIKCLKRPGTPGDLFGDVFFNFTCINCAPDNKETFARQKLPWLMVITLTIYNLSIQSKGLSHQGYFHWRTHIASFIDKNWSFLFDPTMKKKKQWIGTISGTLSLNSPAFFTSGQEYFKGSGWWKLTYNQSPKFYWKLYEELSLKKQQLRNERRNVDETSHSIDVTTLVDDSKRTRRDVNEEQCSRMLPYMGRDPKKRKRQQEPSTSRSESEDNKAMNSVQSSLMDFLAENLSNDEILTDLPQIDTKDLSPLMSLNEHDMHGISDLWNNHADSLDDNPPFTFPENENDTSIQNVGVMGDSNDSDELKPRIIQVTNYQECSKSEDLKGNIPLVSKIKTEPQSEGESEDEQYDLVCEKSLFTIKPKREYPWKDELEEDHPSGVGKNEHSDSKNIHFMTEYEERQLLNKLQAILNVEKDYNLAIPAKIHRFYRKLYLRNIKRSNHKKLFNIDTFGNDAVQMSNSLKPQLLDRFYQVIAGSTNKSTSFHSRIVGATQDDVFESPFTSRLLHPFIYRSTKCFPPWVKLMCELQYAVNGEIPSRASIDYCYVRPYHIAPVNALLQQMFWPGIDMSECLSYPDFSVVALYKKLVVGCAFLVPDVGYNEAYISFMAVRPGWQRCGIASFMLYHLTQTCMGKDITLHVSATNPAICLYQKFGFKIEEVLLDFYDKYLPVNSTHSRHAFLLRMIK